MLDRAAEGCFAAEATARLLLVPVRGSSYFGREYFRNSYNPRSGCSHVDAAECDAGLSCVPQEFMWVAYGPPGP